MKIIYTKKKQEIFVDDEDYEYLNKYTWYIDNGYARTNSKILKEYMHRLVLNINDPKILCDHKDNNRSNNQKSNLRICNRNQNAHNKSKTSKYKGIRFKSKYNKYVSSICINKKSIYLGFYDSDIEAAEQYDIAAIYYHKEFANLNFPEKIDIYPKYIPK